jgi:hypothetical protein
MHAATWLLPPGPVRARYRAELIAELYGEPARTQAALAAGALVHAPQLHRALLEAGELEFPHSTLWCRLHLHHRWHVAIAEDGERFRRCLSCGMDDDETGWRRVQGSMAIAHGTTIG